MMTYRLVPSSLTAPRRGVSSSVWVLAISRRCRSTTEIVLDNGWSKKARGSTVLITTELGSDGRRTRSISRRESVSMMLAVFEPRLADTRILPSGDRAISTGSSPKFNLTLRKTSVRYPRQWLR